MTAVHVLASIGWSPGFRGILVVSVGVIVLCGSAFLLLATNVGSRLGFLIALTGLMGWMTLMGIIWTIYGIGYKGPAPVWRVKEINYSNLSLAQTPIARTLPQPGDLPDPVKVRNSSAWLIKQFPLDKKNPSLDDLLGVDTSKAPAKDKALLANLTKTIGDKTGKWKLLPASSQAVGETTAVVAGAIGPTGRNLFTSASNYVVLDVYTTGGKKPRTSGAVSERLAYKFRTLLQRKNPPAYAVLQLRAALPQVTKPGQAPPLALPNPDKPVISVVMERDLGALREPSIGVTVLSGTVFAILANTLHRRDKAIMRARAAVAAGSK
jgi:hypothetical protein